MTDEIRRLKSRLFEANRVLNWHSRREEGKSIWRNTKFPSSNYGGHFVEYHMIQVVDPRPFVVTTVFLTRENLVEVVTWAKRNCAESVEALFDEKGVPTGFKMGLNRYVNVGLWLVLDQGNYYSWWTQKTYEYYIRVEEESGWEYKYRNHKPMPADERNAIQEYIKEVEAELVCLEGELSVAKKTEMEDG